MNITLMIIAVVLSVAVLAFLVPELVIYLWKIIEDRFLIGRIQDEELWGKRILSVSRKWVKTPPVLKKSDQKSFWIVDSLRDNTKASIQVWQCAALYLALKEYSAYAADDDIERRLANAETDYKKKYCVCEITDSEYAMLAFALYEKQDFSALHKAVSEYVQKYISAEGVIYYKAATGGTAFVDTLGFICPFLVKYGVEEHNESYIGLAQKQFELYFRYGTEKNSSLPFHAFSMQTHIQRGICDWARGLAWLLIGLTDCCRTLSAAGKDDGFYREHIAAYADILMKYQRGSGGFSWQLLSNRETDSSATAVFGWFFACSYGIIGNPLYLERAKKCRSFLMTKTRRDGVVDDCQGDTIGVGVYSRSFGKMPFAQAFALRMQTELNRLGC